MTRRFRPTTAAEDEPLLIEWAATRARARLTRAIGALGGTGAHADEKRALERRLAALDEVVGRYG